MAIIPGWLRHPDQSGGLPYNSLNMYRTGILPPALEWDSLQHA